MECSQSLGGYDHTFYELFSSSFFATFLPLFCISWWMDRDNPVFLSICIFFALFALSLRFLIPAKHKKLQITSCHPIIFPAALLLYYHDYRLNKQRLDKLCDWNELRDKLDLIAVVLLRRFFLRLRFLITVH